jgi:hypothetical protein
MGSRQFIITWIDLFYVGQRVRYEAMSGKIYRGTIKALYYYGGTNVAEIQIGSLETSLFSIDILIPE